MSDIERNRPELTSEEASFVERVTTSYAPPPMSPSQRVAFRQRLDARLGPRRRTWLVAPLAGVAAAAAALALWLAVPGAVEPIPGATPGAHNRATAAPEESEDGSIDEALFALTTSDERDGSLPDDYAAIASLLLDGA